MRSHRLVPGRLRHGRPAAGRLLAGAGLLAVLLAGCAGGGDAQPGGQPSLPIEPPSASGQPGPVPQAQIDATALPGGYPTEVSVTDAGRTVEVKAQEGGCGKASAEVTEQTAATVRITLVETQPAAPGTMCTMDIRYPVVTATLTAPLGTRTVVLTAERRSR
jgi:hypothetical protein